MLTKNTTLAGYDLDLYTAMHHEGVRQEQHIELIASENYVSTRVLEAQGSILTNKYAEGYPGKRYYGGCEFVDQVEQLAIERAKQLFNAAYANVQAHSGSSANIAVFLALLEAGDTILGMGLDQGGHLTHGAKVNFSGKIYNAITYGVNPHSGEIDYEQLAQLAKTHQPKMIIAGFSAYAKIIDWQKFRTIADSVNAYLLADMAHVAGLVATDEYPSPLPFADVVTSTTHKTLRGPRGGLILARDNAAIIKKLDAAIFPGSQGGPLMHIIAAKAVAFKEAMEPEFKIYQQQVKANAKAMAQVFQQRGIKLVGNGTDNHLLLLDLSNTNITGKKADHSLGQAYITVNKNAVPNDPQSPFITSGVRIGTPAVTTRGFKIAEVTTVANWICDILHAPEDAQLLADIRQQVLSLCGKFPVYGRKL
jgi:glycine hydroxymethyltransferase